MKINEDLRHLTYLLRATRQQTRKIFYAQAIKHGLTESWCLVLGVLHRNESSSLGDLAKEIHVGNSTTSGIVDRMVAAGLVTKTRPENNQRQLVIALTEKGKEKYEVVERDYWKVLAPLTDFPTEKTTQIISNLEELESKLEEISNNGK